LAYSWRQLAQLAGVTGGDPFGTGLEALKVAVHYTKPDRVPADSSDIIVAPCSDAAWRILLESAPDSLDWLPANDVVPRGAQLSFDEPVPVLFWGEGYEDGRKPFAELHTDGPLIFYADIVAAVFFLLSRWEETVVSVRDEHDRFPATASVAYRQGFLDRPIVDEYALILREWLKALLPRWEPESRAFSVKLSHDVDVVRDFYNFSALARALRKDMAQPDKVKLIGEDIWNTFSQAIMPRSTPYFRGIEHLARVSLECGFGDDAFYFMAADPAPFNSGYRLSSGLLRGCIEDLRTQGFEIGFHAGYHTLGDPARLAAEKVRLDAVLGESHYGGRQHYLRFRVPDTWCHWERVGLIYDSTMGYADYEGFRCGTCHRFHPFDLKQNLELDLWEQPLIVMDGTLHDYRRLTPDQGAARILALARRCKRVNGTFTLLWHNSSFHGVWQPWGRMYERILGVLAEIEG
jgi:hypothetical protein